MPQKKLLMLCVAGAVIVLSGWKGSTNVKNNNISTETQMNTMSEVIRNNQQSGDENYTGVYYKNGDSQESIETKGGSTIEIQSVSGSNIRFTITCVSSAPSNRIASVIVDGVIGDDNIGEFSYNDDGWGNTGKGALVLKEGQLSLTTHRVAEDKTAMWLLPEYNNEVFSK